MAGLRTYPTYAMGGGYVLSGDVARMLVTVNLKMKLKFTPIEDATLGFWLMSMDLRHIDHNRFHTWAAPCCFKPPVRKDGQRVVTRYCAGSAGHCCPEASGSMKSRLHVSSPLGVSSCLPVCSQSQQTGWHSKAQQSTAQQTQHRTAQHSMAQYSMAQYSTGNTA